MSPPSSAADEAGSGALIDVGVEDGPRVLQLIERAAALGAATVTLSGRELFVRAELLPWAASVAALGLELHLVTDGPLPIPAGRVERLTRLGLRSATLSLTRVADEGYPAIAPLLSPRVTLTIECAVADADEARLRAMVDWLLPLSGITLRFALTDGGREAIEAIGGAIRYGDARVAALGEGPRLMHRGAALCLLPGLEGRHDDARDRGALWIARAGELDFSALTDGEMVKPPVCDGCMLAGICAGLHRSHVAEAAALRPRSSGARSNSFTYSAGRALAKTLTGGCPIYDAPQPYHAGRHLLLDDGAQVIVHHTRTRDFADAAIDRAKHQLGQIYLDRSDKAAPDDFARDLAKLTLADGCRACDRRAGCAGTFAIVEGDLFTVADERVRGYVAEIARGGGRVVDVGCGDGRYGDLWEPAARTGKLRYLGVEPDGARAKALAARWPWAEIRACPVEEVAASEGCDALLVLRSWNHLADPVRALTALVGSLRAGGLFLVVDNVAFGLVRTQAQRARAEAPSSAAGFEHHRNDTSDEAEAALARLPIDLVAHEPVTKEGSNQWLLAFRKR